MTRKKYIKIMIRELQAIKSHLKSLRKQEEFRTMNTRDQQKFVDHMVKSIKPERR